MPQPGFTWEEVAQHNTENDCFVAISGKVYDVTKFINQHPGGRDQLLVGAGRDCTIVFDTYHKTVTKSVLDKYYVGDLVTNELPTFPAPSAFHLAIKSRVENYFKETKQDPKYAPWMFVRYTVFALVYIASYLLQFSVLNSIFALVLLNTVLGCCTALIGLMPLHDSSHFAITHNPTVWKWVGFFHDFFNGISSRVWTYQHTLGHHPYTNIDDADPDIMTASKSTPDIRRIKETQNWFQRYIGQHIYLPVLYSFLGLKTRIQDWTVMFMLKKDGSIRVNDFNNVDLAFFVCFKAIFVLFRFVIPSFYMPIWLSFALLFYSDLIASWYLSLSFQVSHVVGEVAWPLPNAKGNIDQDWAELQITTTLDYATDSWFWTFFTGALNHQTVHHLFPGISQYYYRQITPIMKQTCKEFNIPYHYKDTFWEALGAHINHLWFLGNNMDAKQESQ